MNLDLFRIIKQKAMEKIKPKLIVIFLILTLLILFFLKKLNRNTKCNSLTAILYKFIYI